MGTKEEFKRIVADLDQIDISDKKAIQLMLQPIVKELGLNVIDRRKQWLYNYEEI